MLAQSFMTHTELGVTAEEHTALIKTLVLMETGKLIHERDIPAGSKSDTGAFTGHFNLGWWREHHESCGTICCIAGTAELIGNVSFDNWTRNEGLAELFAPTSDLVWDDVSVAQAAFALRSFLSTGKPNWAEAMA